jgi:hypothetical protein
MGKQVLLLFCMLGHLLLLAQSERVAKLHLIPNSHEAVVITDSFSFSHPSPFIAFSFCWENTPYSTLEIRFSADNRLWTNWYQVGRDSHNPERVVSELGFTATEHRYYQLRSHNIAAYPLQLNAHFYSPGDSPEYIVNTPADLPTPAHPSSCPCPPPSLISRAQWCPAGDCPPAANPVTTQVTHLIVHHAAGTNTASDWPAVVRSIWDFHVNTNGWADIGYNWLVDPQGNAYVGRGNNITGAHFCGRNAGTAGVCMLGNFTNQIPTESARNTLARLLAWKSCDAGIHPQEEALHASSGVVLPRIAGHRDGCTTSCPGDAFYPLLPDLRQQTAAFIDNDCSMLLAPAQLTVTAQAGGVYQLNWIDNNTAETGFLLEKSIGNTGNFGLLADLPANTTSHNEQNLAGGMLFRYRIRTYAVGDTSAYSNTVEIETPTGLSDVKTPPVLLSLFPNPARHELQLRWVNTGWIPNVYIQIFDMLGKSVLTTVTPVVGSSLSLPIGELLPGQYLLRWYTETASGWQVWIKE